MTKNYETENKNMNSNTDKASDKSAQNCGKNSSKNASRNSSKNKTTTLTDRTITLTDTKEKNQQKTNVSPFLQNRMDRADAGRCRIRPVLSSDLFLRPLFCI